MDIPAGAFKWAFKINDDVEEKLDILEWTRTCKELLFRWAGTEIDILYTSLGRHEQGENKRSHHHFNIITDGYGEYKKMQKSDRKRRMFSNLSGWYFKSCYSSTTCKEGEVEKYIDTLAYPLKEGKDYYEEYPQLYKNITLSNITFLRQVGTGLYDASINQHERDEKCKQKKLSDYVLWSNWLADKNPMDYQDVLQKGTQYYMSLPLNKQPTTQHMLEYVKKWCINHKVIGLDNLTKC